MQYVQRTVNRASWMTLVFVLTLVLAVPALGADALVRISFGGANQNTDVELIAMFNEKYAGKIEAEGLGMSLDGIKVSIVGGAPPDVASIDRFEIGAVAAAGFLQPLDDLIARDGINPDDFFPPAWNECMFDGKVYCIPRSTDTRLLWYNKTMFEEFGLNADVPPKTWDDALEYSRRLTTWSEDRLETVGLVPIWGNWFFQGYLWSGGGDLLDPTLRTVTWNDAIGIRTLQFMQSLMDLYGGNEGVVEFGSRGAHLMRRGVQAFEIGTDSYHESQLSDVTHYEWGAASPPRAAEVADTPISWSGGFGLAIPVGVENVDEAWEFIKFYASPEAQLTLSKREIPVLASVATSSEVLSSRPFMPTIIGLMPYSRYRPPVPVASALYTIYRSEILNRFRDGEPPEIILNDTAERAQRILDEGWAAYESRQR